MPAEEKNVGEKNKNRIWCSYFSPYNFLSGVLHFSPLHFSLRFVSMAETMIEAMIPPIDAATPKPAESRRALSVLIPKLSDGWARRVRARRREHPHS